MEYWCYGVGEVAGPPTLDIQNRPGNGPESDARIGHDQGRFSSTPSWRAHRGDPGTAGALILRLCDLKRHDDGTATLNVRAGKGSKQRHATLAAPSVVYLDRWLAQREARFGAARTGAVFCTHADGRCEPVRSGYVRQMLTRLADRTDLGKRLRAHAFRHARASHLHHRGVPMAAIQSQLGHSSPLTTTRYLASIGAHDAHAHVAAAFA